METPTELTDDEILSHIDGIFVTGENQNFNGVYRYRSIGVPSNVLTIDLITLVRACLADRERQKPDVDSSRSAGKSVTALESRLREVLDGWGSATYGWDGNNPAGQWKSEAAHHRECIRRIQAVLDEAPSKDFAEARPTDKPAVGIGSSGELVAWHVSFNGGTTWTTYEWDPTGQITNGLGPEPIIRPVFYTRAPVERQAVAAGWKLVPIEATAEMKAAGQQADDNNIATDPAYAYMEIYRAMLAAAPAVEEPPAT